MNRPVIAGIGTTKFGNHLDRSLGDLAGDAVAAALSDAGLSAGDLDCVFASNSGSSSWCGEGNRIGIGVATARAVAPADWHCLYGAARGGRRVAADGGVAGGIR